jgi:hypothetical protein
VLSGASVLTGLPTNPGKAGLVQDIVSGTISDLETNGQGAAGAVGLGPAIPDSPQVNRIMAMLNPDKYPPPEEHGSKER